MSVNAEKFEECTPPDLRETANKARGEILPKKSVKRYEEAYANFQKWQHKKNASGINSENIFLAYFQELSERNCPSTLWSTYSMLKAMIKLHFNTNIAKYTHLVAFLKSHSKGYTPVKAKVFTNEEVKRFIDDAPDEIYLATKVVLIFGLTGACRTDELVNITIDQIQTYDKMFLVKIPVTKTAVARTFTISDMYFDIVSKYKDLRPQNITCSRFFLNFQKGKCTCQPIGKNKLAQMPQRIAEYLNLEDTKRYTGHSFRRTSATMLANAGANLLTLKRHGSWRSTTVAESYIEDSVFYKQRTESMITSHLHSNSPSDVMSTTVESSDPDITTVKSVPVTTAVKSIPDTTTFESVPDNLLKQFHFNNCNNVTINFG